MRRRVVVLISAAIIGAAIYLVHGWPRSTAVARQEAEGTGQVREFTATRFDARFHPGNWSPVRGEVRTYAVRSDGSHVEARHRPDPSGSGNVFYMKKITDVPGKRRVAVDPWSESVTSYPQREEGIRFHAAKVVSDCGGKAAGELLGYPVTLVESVFSSQEVGLEGPEVRQLAWHANQLNCFPLRKEIRLFDGGKEIARTVETVVSVTEGQPDPSHFQIPAGYVERSPSEAMAEAARRYPKIMEIQCGPCQNTRLDEAYFHHQREHQ